MAWCDACAWLAGTTGPDRETAAADTQPLPGLNFVAIWCDMKRCKWWRYRGEDISLPLPSPFITLHPSISQHFMACAANDRTWRATCGSIAGLRGSGNLRSSMFAGCARVYMVSFHGQYGTMTAEHAEPFWSFLVMSKVRPLNNKEKRNKDREALKVMAPSCRRATLAVRELQCRNIEAPQTKQKQHISETSCFQRSALLHRCLSLVTCSSLTASSTWPAHRQPNQDLWDFQHHPFFVFELNWRHLNDHYQQLGMAPFIPGIQSTSIHIDPHLGSFCCTLW